MSRGTELVAIVSDVHFPHTHWPSWRAFKQWARHNRPDQIVMAGDMLDFAALSRYPQEVGAAQDVASEIKVFVRESNSILPFTRRLTNITGNHDERWFCQVIEPIAVQAGGLRGLDLETQCRHFGLNKRIEWHQEGLAWRGLQIAQVTVRHGHKQGSRFGSATPARSALVRTLGTTQGFGHTHRLEVTFMGERFAFSNGHLSADHSYSLENNWTRGFTILEVDRRKNFAHPYPVMIRDGRFAWGRRVYAG